MVGGPGQEDGNEAGETWPVEMGFPAVPHGSRDAETTE